MVMPGLTPRSLIKHPALIPLFGILGFGVALSGGYLLRLATRSPDVSWDKRNNPTPWEEYSNKQYKFYASDTHRSVDPRPKIDWQK